MVGMFFEIIHNWQPVKSDVHIEFPTKTEGKRKLHVEYVRCSKCKQLGYRRYGSPVVYTWQEGEDIKVPS